MTQEQNSRQNKKSYSPIKVSLLGNISELTKSFSGSPSVMGGMMMGGGMMGGMM